MRALRISPAAYREALAVRTREHAHLNAYLSEAFHTALDEVTPENPLFGVLLAVKDNIDVAGVRTTAGTPALRRHLPSRSSTVWERCARAGAALAGKTALHELAYGITGHHALGPPSLNPPPRTIWPVAAAREPPRPSPRASYRQAWAPTPEAPSASRRRSAASSGTGPPWVATRLTGWCVSPPAGTRSA
ncbi:hypothetical protein ID875_27905 [Streptomyces globisporus]|uniref:Amidase domain-containing protein n=1 Tax=Streptomyces globisporus TaxID=1908 RepID=A0A927BMG9_STRGL|nr:hypothetical protein [Streptomyces globisporus]